MSRSISYAPKNRDRVHKSKDKFLMIEKNPNGSWTAYSHNDKKMTYYLVSKNEATKKFKRYIKNV